MKIAKEDIQDTGLNVLFKPDQPVTTTVDIVLVHGIQSHPRRAWEYKSNEPKPTEAKKSSTSGPLHSTLKRISGWGKRIQGKEIQDKEAQNKVPQGETIQSEEVVDKNVKGKEVEGREVQDSGSTSPAPPLATGTHGIQASNSEGGDKYWPLDFLPDKCPSARIIAWGYDTQVTKGYVAATQHNIFSLGRDLLFGLAGDREQEGILGRPIVFVAHSLGGIIVKEALRRSEIDDEAEIKDIITSTAAVLFLGTPHRGSSAAQLADVVRTVASVVLRLDTNDKVLQALSGANSPELELGRESFISLWRKYNFKVKTFQESQGMTGLNIGSLNELVVPSYSSSLDDTREHPETITANHVDMCKFKSVQDDGYKRVSTALSKFVRDATSKNLILTDREKACLASLRFDTLESRQSQVRSAPLGTCDWLYNLHAFRNWHDRAKGYENSMLWIKGKPGSGKSVLMKSLVQRVQRERKSSGNRLVADVIHGRAVAAFFFRGRQNRYYETRPAGLYRTLVYQLFKQDPYLRRRLLLEYELRKAEEPWRDDEVEDLFVDVYLRGEVNIPLKSAFIFVDAVDECHEDSVRSVVNLLSKLAEKTNFNICLSSRHYPHISAPNCVEIIVEKHNSADILHYIRSTLSGAFPNRDSVVRTISNKAAGVFLWVEIVLELLNRKIDNGEPAAATLRTLDAIPSRIEDLYQTLLLELNTEDQKTAVKIFQWVLLAAEPLTLAGLRYALAFTSPGTAIQDQTDALFRPENPKRILAPFGRDVPPSLHEWKNSADYIRNPEQFLRWLRAHSRGLVEVQSETKDDDPCTSLDGQVVQCIHETVRTFFLTDNGFRILNPADSTYYHHVSIGHQALLRACLNSINIEDLSSTEDESLPRGPRGEDEIALQWELRDRVGFDPYSSIQTWTGISPSPFLHYAVNYLFYHFLFLEAEISLEDIFIDALSERNGRIWRRWKLLSRNPPLEYSWLGLNAEGERTRTRISNILDGRLNLD